MTAVESVSDDDISDETVREMVRHLEPSWEAESVSRVSHGSDFVAVIDVDTPDGTNTVVLKASTAEWMSPEIARVEPRILSIVERETTIPVPPTFGYCDAHETYPSPFYLMGYIEGENFEGRGNELSSSVRERILSDAGRNLAQLHELGPLSSIGRMGVVAGQLCVPERDDNQRTDSFHEWLLENYENTLDALTEGGYFPDLAEDKTRFADLVPKVRSYLRETIPNLPEPDPPTYCHQDYRYGNLLVDPETGETNAVVDWGLLMGVVPAYNLANAESHLLSPEHDGEERTAELRQTFRSAYADTRTDWSFDAATCERIEVYRLTCRLDAMACLPLWYQDASSDERNQRAKEHRAFVERYL